jgi:hypothetical protein
MRRALSAGFSPEIHPWLEEVWCAGVWLATARATLFVASHVSFANLDDHFNPASVITHKAPACRPLI